MGESGAPRLEGEQVGSWQRKWAHAARTAGHSSCPSKNTKSTSGHRLTSARSCRLRIAELVPMPWRQSRRSRLRPSPVWRQVRTHKISAVRHTCGQQAQTHERHVSLHVPDVSRTWLAHSRRAASNTTSLLSSSTQNGRSFTNQSRLHN